MLFDVTIEGHTHHLELELLAGAWQARLNGRELALDAVLAGPDLLALIVNGRVYEVMRERSSAGTDLWVGRVRYQADLSDPRSLRGRKGKAGSDRGPVRLLAAMPGKVVRVLIAEKTEVNAGQGVLVIEAMKMQNEVKSPKRGIVQKIMAREGSRVNAGEVLAVVE
ncbi:MAG: acetyl-CoA carboxylase biotin carboxyl carrier protein subunit [Acidobacteria bacterium]|nr:acetyl-CoA carboxylase biotin carboxyl carrier protein subunit [Acidobacteriota bacterium]